MYRSAIVLAVLQTDPQAPATMKPLLLHSVVHVHLLQHLALIFLLAMQLQLQLHPCLLLAAMPTGRSSLAAGESLSPPNYITSPSGDFAFGFLSLDSNTSNSSSFLLAIWFHSDPASTVVWFAAADEGSGSSAAVLAGAQSVLNLTTTGQLSLTANPSNVVVWDPQSYGYLLVLLDTGNLQLLGKTTKPKPKPVVVVWESFRHPTDTILPGQTMAAGARLRSRSSDSDSDSDSDFSSPGRFVFVVQWDGNLVWYRTDLPPAGVVASANAYMTTGTCCVDNGNTTTLTFDDKLVGYLYFQFASNDTTKNNLTTAASDRYQPAGFFYQRATLDPDGILRVYVLPKINTTTTSSNGGNATSSSWSVVSSVPSDGCQTKTVGGQAMCGPNSYCVYGGAAAGYTFLNCQCPTGYTFLDAQLRHKGCVPAFLQDTCDADDNTTKKKKSRVSEFKLVEVPNTYWANPVFYEQHRSITADQCGDFCLQSCLCSAALFDASSDTCFEAAMLTSGWQQNGSSMRTLVKVRARRAPTPVRMILPYAAIAGLGMLLLATACVLVVHCYVTKKKERSRKHVSVTVFSRRELRRATNGFSRLLGQGGFGKVYHGVLRKKKSLEPPLDVAVKELIIRRVDEECRETEFENEVQSIGRIHHRNLVRMLGYCKEGLHRMLVFEFMPGGSLADVLFKPAQRPEWRWRAEAAMAIARGLEYLHYGCSSQIVHCDIKPDNILLDGRGAPKITDFGIARLIHGDKLKQTITHVRGTLGYLAPEWFSSSDRKVDSKVDVFSFGVVLLEIICCRKHPPPPAPAPAVDARTRCSDSGSEEEEEEDESEDKGVPVTLRAWVSDLIREEGSVGRAVEGDEEAVQDMERVERFARIAMWCVQGDPSLRPTMRKVVWMLEGTMDVDPLPPDPPVASRVPDLFPAAAAASSGTTRDIDSNSSSIYYYD